MGRFAICLFLSALPLLAGCSETVKVSDQDVQQLQYKELLPYLAGKNGTTVTVDVRPAKDFDNGHIPGAINIFLPQIVAGDERLGSAKNIVVYASGWTDPLSPAGAKRFLAVGYTNVLDFRGGIEVWKSEGRRLESSSPTTQGQ